ncbi:MAG: SPASM domain-containing protein [Oscillospiraceae bacterium]|nr:SPASM domain-containing protein [Oscillospiraceae bacterium]
MFIYCTQDYSLAINPSLDVYPCCSQCIENTILNMGNLKYDTLLDIVDNIKYNKVMHTIFTEGFTPFVQILKSEKIKYPIQLSSHCEMCEYLFSSDWFLKILEEKNIYEN